VNAAWTFSLTIPDGFFAVPLDGDPNDDRRATEVEVDAAIARKPELAGGRELLVEQAVGFAADARGRGALAAALAIDSLEGSPLSAYVFVLDGPRGHPAGDGDADAEADAEIDTLAEGLRLPRPGDAGGREVDLVDLPAGRAVRARFLAETEPAPETNRVLLMDCVQHWIPVPGEPAVMVLSCSTPHIAVGDALAEVFDGIAQTVRIETAPAGDV
jgi:hypothetical protein